MDQSTKRAENSGEEARGRRAEVARAALEMFLARGYAGTSMAAVAKAAGINKSSLYHHFPSKEAMFVAALAADIAEPLDRLAALAAQEDIAPDERLRAALGYAHDAMIGQSMGKMITAIAETAREIPEVARAFHLAVVERFRVPMRAIFDMAAEAGTHRPVSDPVLRQVVFGPLMANAMTEIMFAATPDLAAEHARGGDRESFVEMIDALMRT